jgi:calcineurin-like phosphoesterase family protein
MIWFTSDWHLGHSNILKPDYDNRPFDTIQEHDEVIIHNFNDLVEDNDTVYYLGDFALCRKDKMERYISQLRGKLNFIRGNHDKNDTIKLYKKYGNYLGEQATIEVNKQKITLNHCKMYVWFHSHHGAWNVHGHSHGGLDHVMWGKSIDVSINLTRYYPVSFPALKKIMDEKHTIHFPDGHKTR